MAEAVQPNLDNSYLFYLSISDDRYLASACPDTKQSEKVPRMTSSTAPATSSYNVDSIFEIDDENISACPELAHSGSTGAELTPGNSILSAPTSTVVPQDFINATQLNYRKWLSMHLDCK
ncbi:hypothetical protein TPHA_0D03630 [Tetrapisispora phaffii CBS 4417]|uniref:Uncharacterized protein n=1 Tax=Tetrapisispora phaffii (strain ATCC 24235 / CBS 4417 / NBRC 1672 / NRRL Y-8282 / UCD 70-5) TaxID=1071381 RepID=G8BT27_TETPH|nr:hypothetical protein TPHA_0D03630 [Tetrapisispora phaffii CBS 4417]CCE62998.1 hypothetical protein TPHA_0D03630 [Tetrapisispora phaffii CBS 4417]